MRILLCAATELEIKPTIDFINNNQLEGKVDLLITGVGLTAATYSLTRHFILYRPQLVIQAGVAGALNVDLALGEVVLVASEVIGDEGVLERGTFRSLFQMNLAEAHKLPFQNGRLANPHLPTFAKDGMRLVNSVSVNQISTDIEQINYYCESLGADIETMEGGALHYTALQENLPFLQMRAISNYIGERDKSKWVLKDAIAQLNKELQHLLTKSIYV